MGASHYLHACRSPHLRRGNLATSTALCFAVWRKILRPAYGHQSDGPGHGACPLCSASQPALLTGFLRIARFCGTKTSGRKGYGIAVRKDRVGHGCQRRPVVWGILGGDGNPQGGAGQGCAGSGQHAVLRAGGIIQACSGEKRRQARDRQKDRNEDRRQAEGKSNIRNPSRARRPRWQRERCIRKRWSLRQLEGQLEYRESATAAQGTLTTKVCWPCHAGTDLGFHAQRGCAPQEPARPH